MARIAQLPKLYREQKGKHVFPFRKKMDQKLKKYFLKLFYAVLVLKMRIT